jgi:hypothetical protein
MNLKQALARIEELERKVKELEARPAQQIHYHTHQPPTYQPFMPTVYPTWPNRNGDIYCGNIGAGNYAVGIPPHDA